MMSFLFDEILVALAKDRQIQVRQSYSRVNPQYRGIMSLGNNGEETQ
jgi:hypothetical protein